MTNPLTLGDLRRATVDEPDDALLAIHSEHLAVSVHRLDCSFPPWESAARHVNLYMEPGDKATMLGGINQWFNAEVKAKKANLAALADITEYAEVLVKRGWTVIPPPVAVTE